MKRRMLAPQSKPKKVKKLKRDTVYNPDGKECFANQFQFSALQ